MTGIIVLGSVVAIILVFIVVVYNGLIRHRNLVREGWSGIDVQLKKRYDLIPALVKAVKAYADHEKALLEEITRTRTAAMEASGVAEQGMAESAINRALGRLKIVVESYPDLKANENFLDLQQQLSQVENDLSLSRRYYNGTVRNNNIAIESFPNNLIAGWFSFKQADFFEIDESEKAVPDLDVG